MTRRWCLSFVFVLLALALVVPSASAKWIRNGVRVCDNPGHSQSWVQLVPDGEHGAIIVWLDLRNGVNWDIFGNRIEADGYIETCGVPITEAPADQVSEQIIPDGTGGVIAVWSDYRNATDIYAQRIDGTGTPQWATDGIPITLGSFNAAEPKIVTDGAGGAIIAWADTRRGEYDIYAQRVTANGDTLWKANGMPVDTTQGDQEGVQMVSDGAGGAIMVWQDTRNAEWDIYAQRVGGDGSLLWGPNAVAVRVDPNSQTSVTACPTPDGGACVVWTDNRNGYYNAFAQKIDPNGTVVWPSNGVLLCTYPSNQWNPASASDGAGGAIVVWNDDRVGDYPTYTQRIDATGVLAWPSDGTQVFSMYGTNYPSIISDGSGGAFVALDVHWVAYEPADIYVQKLDHDGTMPWGPKGASACNAPFEQYRPTMTPDALGGVVVAWEDERIQDGNTYIYCQRLGPSGLWGDPEPQIVSCSDVPVDQGGWVRIRVRASSHDIVSETDTPIFGYNVWRLIGGGGPIAAAGAGKPPVIDRSKLAELLSDPATAVGVRVGKAQAASLGLPEGDWETVGFWFATRDTVYSVAVPTRDDSTGAGTAQETYCVTAHASSPGIYVTSAPATGHSVDNFAPGGTPDFAGSETASPPGLELTWSPNPVSDMGTYNVYRGDNELFAPDASNLVGSTKGTALHDGSWARAYTYFYKLVAVDKHGNMGPAALLRPEDIEVGTMLQSFAALLKQSAIEVTWKLSEVDETATFNVLRSAGGGEFAELPSVEIAREGLSFTLNDKSVEPGTSYRYRVAVVEGSGTRTLFETDEISMPAMPLTLNQNHPNPFNPSTTISYYLPTSSPVTLDVYDSSGRLVSRLVDGAMQERGTHEVAWRGLDTSGRQVSSGVYFYRLTSGKETISKKMVLLR